MHNLNKQIVETFSKRLSLFSEDCSICSMHMLNNVLSVYSRERLECMN